MNSITPTSASDFNQAAYYNIIAKIGISGELTIPKGSVLDFCGGSFCGSGTINLNGAKVVAAPYCIFGKDVSVSGFAQSEVLAEWFNDKSFFPSTSSGTETKTFGEEVFINKAIQSARGCPVVTNARQYKLKDSIKFIPGTTPQTLICPGELCIERDNTKDNDNQDDNTAAILLENVSYVTLKINFIRGYAPLNPEYKYDYRGIGICFRGSVHMADIDVFLAQTLQIGLDLSPKASVNGAYIQDCKFKFQLIKASTCINIDLFAHNTVADYPRCWITSNQFHGGRLIGREGIVFGTPNTDFFEGGSNTRPTAHVNSLVFDCIGIEKIFINPIYLAYVAQSKFQDIRMMESLPGTGDKEIGGNDNSPWISFYNVSDLEIGLKGYILPSHLSIVKESQQFTPPVPAPDPYSPNVVDNVIVKCDVLDSSLYKNHFDTIVFRTPNPSDDNPEPHMFVTNSIQPYNMAKCISAPSLSNTDSVDITDIIPALEITLSNQDEETNYVPLYVLPETLFIKSSDKSSTNLMIQLKGLWRLPKMISSFSIYKDMPFGASVSFPQPNDNSFKIITGFNDSANNLNYFFNRGLFNIEWARYEMSGTKLWPMLRIIQVTD